MKQPKAWHRWFESRSGAAGIVYFKPADMSCAYERGIDCGAPFRFDVRGKIGLGPIPDHSFSQRAVGADYRRQNSNSTLIYSAASLACAKDSATTRATRFNLPHISLA
jgi:hypothetical protein